MFTAVILDPTKMATTLPLAVLESPESSDFTLISHFTVLLAAYQLNLALSDRILIYTMYLLISLLLLSAAPEEEDTCLHSFSSPPVSSSAALHSFVIDRPAVCRDPQHCSP